MTNNVMYWLIFSVVGSVLIVGGLYAVLWGKDRELKQMMKSSEGKIGDATKLPSKDEMDGKDDDLELQLHHPKTEAEDGNREACG